MRVVVVINPKAAQARSGSAFSGHLKELFDSAGIKTRFVDGRDMAGIESMLPPIHSGVDGLVSAGGDGTLRSVAEIALAHDLPLGVLPLGTRNHFARDLNLPLGLPEAVRTIAGGKLKRVDLGEVNGRIFVNNSSIGAYPRAVQERETLRDRYGLRKMAAMAVAVLRVFSRSPLLDARVILPDQTILAVSPFIFVGNNRYDPRLQAPRFRTSLEEGVLCVFAARCNGLKDFFRLLWLSFTGRLEYSRDFQSYLAETVTVELSQREARVSADGEVWRARTPLHYRIRKKALQVYFS